MSTSDHLTRRNLVAAIGGGAAALLLGGAPQLAQARAQSVTDADILIFALNLEYLEAEFYAMATTGRGLRASDTIGATKTGETTGGRKVNFQNPELARIAAEIAEDELLHVRFLRTALGSAAPPKPAINLNALGIGFKDDAEFITLARAFEDVGVSAYKGAARLIQSKDYLDAAAGILATEAYHAGNLRTHAVYLNLRGTPLDAVDQPPTAQNTIPVDPNGITPGRTPDQVLAIVRGQVASGGAFFPQGLNGKIR